ncbi:hypothetical protein R6Q59_026818 [Mikania micrantha]
MNAVKRLGSELLGYPNSRHDVSFPSLEVLEFKGMQGWEEWSTNGCDKADLFPRLHEISIINCPKLDVVAIELVPSVRVLYMKECSIAVLTSMINVSSSIIRLTIWGIKGLTQLHNGVLEHLRAVEYLSILQCDELTYLWKSEAEASQNLASLQKLEVSGCANLVSLGEKKAKMVTNMEYFREVEIDSCPKLENYYCSNNIEKLKISRCGSITSLEFPTMQNIPSTLKILKIEDCDRDELASQQLLVIT